MRRFDRPRNWLAHSGLTALGLVALAVGEAHAHHSLTAEFDTRKILVLTGVVSHVQWVNPHIYVDLDVTDSAGKVASWHLECVPVAMARKAGVSMKTLMGNGERVTVDAFPARDGSPHLGFLAKITYPDGHHVQFAPMTPAADPK
ncbi:MAG TPA: DUF6152 family protein [Steroidobacteraceae bacterium]